MSDPQQARVEAAAERRFAFDMQVAEKDKTGYYHTRWDRAVPLTVYAANRDEAFRKAWAVMGSCRYGFTWTASIKSIREVSTG